MKVKLLGVVALMALVIASCAGGNPEAAGPSEGIQVHGDWTIDIYNEDGTLDKHVEFANALDRGGAQLISLLTGQVSASGIWELEFRPGCPSNSVDECSIKGVIAQAIDTGTDGRFDLLRLTGSTVVESDAEIARVQTQVGLCVSAVAPADCTNGENNAPFTTKHLSPTVPVAAGQTVDIQVDISFTTG